MRGAPTVRSAGSAARFQWVSCRRGRSLACTWTEGSRASSVTRSGASRKIHAPRVRCVTRQLTPARPPHFTMGWYGKKRSCTHRYLRLRISPISVGIVPIKRSPCAARFLHGAHPEVSWQEERRRSPRPCPRDSRHHDRNCCSRRDAQSVAEGDVGQALLEGDAIGDGCAGAVTGGNEHRQREHGQLGTHRAVPLIPCRGCSQACPLPHDAELTCTQQRQGNPDRRTRLAPLPLMGRENATDRLAGYALDVFIRRFVRTPTGSRRG
jgi:hypothetical protein